MAVGTGVKSVLGDRVGHLLLQLCCCWLCGVVHVGGGVVQQADTVKVGVWWFAKRLTAVVAVLNLQANYLRSVGVKKGDAVSIYMPMVCELPIAMLACARIGAVHSVVFGGFSAEALAGAHNSNWGQGGFVAAWLAPRIIVGWVADAEWVPQGRAVGLARARCLVVLLIESSNLGWVEAVGPTCVAITGLHTSALHLFLCSAVCGTEHCHVLPCFPCVTCPGRMHDCEAKVLLTASGVMRGNKKIDLKAIADSGLDMCEKQGKHTARKCHSDIVPALCWEQRQSRGYCH